MSSQQTVYNLLLVMEKDMAYSNILLNDTLMNSDLGKQDKALVTAIFYGVIERKMTLNYIIRQCSKVAYDSLPKETIILLRIGFYELIYMNSIEDFTAVDETVKLADVSAKGFINAILRNFIRNQKKVNLESLDELGALSINYSCPKWIVKRLISYIGMEHTVNFLSSSLERAPIYGRVNTLKCNSSEAIAELAKDGISAKKSQVLDNCIEIEKLTDFVSTTCFQKGYIHIEDISAQMCCKIVNPKKGSTVLDMCAAPGGKTFMMATLMENNGRIISCDVYPHKMELIEKGASRLGLQIVEPRLNDGTIYNADIPQCDTVLCDVPCSGFGVFRRKPEIKYKEMGAVLELPALQKSILETAARYVKPGGTLFYSTCTVHKMENDDVVDAFLAEHKDFLPEEVDTGMSNFPKSYKYMLLPEYFGGDGFFIASLRRVDG